MATATPILPGSHALLRLRDAGGACGFVPFRSAVEKRWNSGGGRRRFAMAKMDGKPMKTWDFSGDEWRLIWDTVNGCEIRITS